MFTKKQNKEFLRICKSTGFIKFSQYLKRNKVSPEAFSRFVNYDNYDGFISNDNLNIITDEIYNSCLFIVDMYNDINKKVA